MYHINEKNWIWLPKEEWENYVFPLFVYARKEIELEDVLEKTILRIIADSRYKLYINGTLVEVGPSKGDTNLWFYDQMDISAYLRKGKNVFAVILLHYPSENRNSSFSIFRTDTPGLWIQVSCGDQILLETDESWQMKLAVNRQVQKENQYFSPLFIYENFQADEADLTWKTPSFGGGDWKQAVLYEAADLVDAPFVKNLQKRTIPFMHRISRRFQDIKQVLEGPKDPDIYRAFIKGRKALEIPSYSKVSFEIDTGELMTGYLSLPMTGGKNTKLTVLQSEAYVVDDGGGARFPTKKDRADHINGYLDGYTDFYTVCGKGTKDNPEFFEPFWFRTFRYIRLTVETAEDPVSLLDFTYEETGYPWDFQTQVKTSSADFEKIWDISERTLKRCTHETYEDCPFYEQLQYAMDARSQMLYCYATTADDRLARKCMDDFRRATKYDGLPNCCYPSRTKNVIPGFSIYYIGMLYDHMMYFGDKELVKEHIPGMQMILDFFERHLDEKGYVEKIGGPEGDMDFWSFIDWTPEWNDNWGVPMATRVGPLTAESLLYIMGLQYMEAMYRWLSMEKEAKMVKKRAESVQQAIRTWCRGKDGMIKDGPNYEVYSQHCQVLAILTDTITVEEGKRYLLESLRHKEDYAQCSVAILYYLFRALEKCGIYEETEELWDIWKDMLRNNMTTCAEDPLKSRSDCHAWGALILYELPSVLLGVRPAAPGYEKVCIQPQTGTLDFAEGTVFTPKGKIYVSWKKEQNQIILKTDLPEGLDTV